MNLSNMYYNSFMKNGFEESDTNHYYRLISCSVCDLHFKEEYLESNFVSLTQNFLQTLYVFAYDLSSK